jgi:hypothetical protein
MNYLKSFLFLLIVLLMTFLHSCILRNQPVSTLISKPNATEITPTAIPATNTPNILPTLIPTNTLTFLPTLSNDDAYTRLRTLMNVDKSCQLPCWLGITPGRTTQIDAQQQLTLFGGIATKTHISTTAGDGSFGILVIPYPNDNMAIEVDLSYLLSDDGKFVSVIFPNTRAYKLKNGNFDGDLYGYPYYNDLMKAYSLSEILSSYGPPSQIFVRANLSTDKLPLPPNSLDSFVIHLWYPDQGIFMEYSMLAGGSGATYRFCPSNSFISGVLLPVSQGIGYQEILKKLGGVYSLFFPPASNVKTSEDALGMTVGEFFRTFISPTNRCLETPKSIWWPK